VAAADRHRGGAPDRGELVSETPQGPGWWLASDGRYYPPESAPRPAYPPQQADPPQQAYPPVAGFRPPPRRGRGGKVALLVVVLVVIGLVVGAKVLTGVVSNWFGSKTEALVGGSGCPFITDTQVSSLVGGKVTLAKAGALTSIVSQVIDSRVIPQAQSCWAMSDGQGSSSGDPARLMRIASQTGSDAATVFKSEVTKARGVTVDKGNGLSVSSEKYYNKPVAGLGDEAFCTTASTVGPGSAGVLVRKADRLVYVSLTPDFSRGAPGIGTPGTTTLSTDDGSCALAQKIAAAVLGN
jgi:hypothetical protein